MDKFATVDRRMTGFWAAHFRDVLFMIPEPKRREFCDALMRELNQDNLDEILNKFGS